MIQTLMTWYANELASGGYWLVAALMAAESSILPVPSELVIPVAAHVAVTRGGMTPLGIVVAGTLGSWVGASLMYWGARLVGRPLVLRFGKYVLVPPHKLVQAEAWSDRFGAMGIFISRLLPVIRHLIGLPAGLVRYPQSEWRCLRRRPRPASAWHRAGSRHCCRHPPMRPAAPS